MMYNLLISEGAEATGSARRMVQKERRPYWVLKPIFKNGRTYQPNEVIKLDEDTAKRFIELGEIKEF